MAAPELRVASGAVSWYQSDRLGSVRTLTNSTGVVKDTIEYDAFGKITSESDSTYSDKYKYTGQRRDSTTGFQEHGAREYNPLEQTLLQFNAWLLRAYRAGMAGSQRPQKLHSASA